MILSRWHRVCFDEAFRKANSILMCPHTFSMYLLITIHEFRRGLFDDFTSPLESLELASKCTAKQQLNND